MEIEQCKRCGASEIHNKSRQLCESCAAYLCKHKRLNEYPLANALRRAYLFREQLKNKYGDKIILDFELCIYNLNDNLAKIGRKYGFCRERARQIFNNLFDKDYVEKRKQTRALIDKKERIIQFHPDNKFNRVIKESSVGIGFKGELIVYDKLKELGFNVSYPIKRSPYDLIIDNLKVEVKTGGISAPTSGKVLYYKAKLTKSEFKHSNFVIFYIPKTKAFYIIPILKMTGRNIFIKDTNSPNRKTRYEKYKDMWELLNCTNAMKEKNSQLYMTN